MKKFLLAAALAAFTSAVSAQTVTVYGVVDTGFQMHNNGTDTYSRASNSGLAASRLGFRGSEDLGKGLKLQFQLEAGLNPSNGSVGVITATSNEMFNRAAWLGVSGAFGEIRVGRQDVTAAHAVDTFTSQFGMFGNRAVNGTGIDIGLQQKNVIRYISPTLGGFYVQTGFGSANAAGAGADTAGDQQGVLIGYDRNGAKLFVGTHRTDATATAASRGFNAYGAAYNFGTVSVGITHAAGAVNNANGAKNTNTQGSVKVPLSAGLALHGVYAVAKNGAHITNGEGSGYTLGMTKTLSKRTTLYAAYTTVNNEANGRMHMAGQGAPATGGLDTKTWVAGVSHSF